MNYQETLAWMFSQLPMYQNQGKTAFKKDLTNSILFSSHLGIPESKFNAVHVAGTNGKGSTSHMIASVLQEAGYKVGLYTSPHLKDFRERIKINGQMIPEEEVVGFIAAHRNFFQEHQLSFFEMTVGLAFNYFAQQNVDVAIIEVGLGGRLDSTNIIRPLLSVITNIGLDHTQMLGDTLEQIAHEKAGIIKKDIPVIIGEYQQDIHHVFYNKALENNASLFIAEHNIKQEYSLDLTGTYQIKNAKTAVQAIQVLQELNYDIADEHLKRGLNNVIPNNNLLGRWQLLQEKPKIICDTAHNKEGLALVLNQLSKLEFKYLHIVLGVVNDKDLKTVLPLFPKNAIYYFAKPEIPRGLDAQTLKETAQEFGLSGKVFTSVSKALSEAKNKSTIEDVIFVGGSTFVVAEVV